MNWFTSRRWKYSILALVRRSGMLGAVDRGKYLLSRTRSHFRNAAFIRSRPDFAVPPGDLAFDAYNHVDWQAYHDVGRKHAQVFTDILRTHAPGKPLTVLE